MKVCGFPEKKVVIPSIVSLLSLAAIRRPSGEKRTAWIASGWPRTGCSPLSERARWGVPFVRHSSTRPEEPPTASSGAAGDHASAVMTARARLTVKDACRCKVWAENSPTVELPRRTANVAPSGERASGGASGATGSQQDGLSVSAKRRPKLRSPARSHSSTRPPTDDV